MLSCPTLGPHRLSTAKVAYFRPLTDHPPHQDFYEDVFEELAQHGELENLNVCDNFADHMVGNVYAKFRDEDAAARALASLQVGLGRRRRAMGAGVRWFGATWHGAPACGLRMKREETVSGIRERHVGPSLGRGGGARTGSLFGPWWIASHPGGWCAGLGGMLNARIQYLLLKLVGLVTATSFPCELEYRMSALRVRTWDPNAASIASGLGEGREARDLRPDVKAA